MSKPSKRYYSLKRATLLNWGNFAVHTILGLLTTPIVIDKIGLEGFGVWSIVVSISGYYGLANLGIGAALGRYVTRDIELNDLPSLQATVDAASYFFLLTGASILAAVSVFGEDIAAWLRISDVSHREFAVILLIASAGIISDFFKSITSTILSASERYTVSSALEFVQRIFQAAGTLAILNIRPGLLELSIVLTANSVVFQAAAQIVARRSVPGLRFVPGKLATGRLRELLGFGSSSLLISIVNLIRLRLGSILIARYADMAAVGNFAIASNLITNFSSIITSSTSVVGVRFTKLDAANDLANLQATYRSALFSTALMTFGIAFLMYVFADRFVLLWLGEGHTDAVRILQVLLVGYALNLGQAPGWNMMFARSKHRVLAWISLLEAIANIGLGILLLRHFGPIGFAWSTTLTMATVKLTIQPWLAARVVGFSLWRFFEPLACPLLVGTAGILLSIALQAPGWIRQLNPYAFLALAGLCSLLYLSVVFALTHRKDYFPASFLANWRKFRARFS